MSPPLLLGIDEGTTAVKAALFDSDLRPLAQAQRRVPLHHPRPGWVEQDPLAIERAVIDSVAEVLRAAGRHEVIAAGLDHQGESVLAWDTQDLRPLTPVIVWQDKRSEQILQRLDGAAIARSGLPLDPYFSAGKLAWLLERDPAVGLARERGTLRLGTVDAFLVSRLAAGRFATDLSTASRTQLLALGGADWDESLLETFGIPRETLPVLGDTFGELGELRHLDWPASLPLCAQLVDQQAALAGSGCVLPGEAKATYGTGVFVLACVQDPHAMGGSGLLPTVAWASRGRTVYAADGGVFAAGALLEWLADGLGLAPDVPTLARAAATVPDSAGVAVLPALSGLGAPYWHAEAHAVIAGLHAGVRPAHIARAALEAIVWRVADNVAAIERLTPLSRLFVDGGLTNDPTLLRLQANALGLPLARTQADVTVRGAAMLAGVGAGLYESVQDAARRLPQPEVIEPDRVGRDDGAHERWRSFVRAAAALPGL